MFRRRIGVALVASLACVGPHSLAADNKVGRDGFISAVGTYPLYHGKLTLKIYEEQGKLNYKIALKVSISERISWFARIKFDGTQTWGPSKPFVEKGAKWFAFVESSRSRSPKAVWIFDGRDYLRKEAFGSGPGCDDNWVSSDSEAVPGIVNTAPKSVRDRLPEAFKRKFQGP